LPQRTKIPNFAIHSTSAFVVVISSSAVTKMNTDAQLKLGGSVVNFTQSVKYVMPAE